MRSLTQRAFNETVLNFGSSYTNKFLENGMLSFLNFFIVNQLINY